MKRGFGKHSDKSIEVLLLKDPDYVFWMLDLEDSAGSMARACAEASRLIAIFDEKPMLGTCAASLWERQVTTATCSSGATTVEGKDGVAPQPATGQDSWILDSGASDFSPSSSSTEKR